MRTTAILTGIAFVLAMHGSTFAQEAPAEPENAQVGSEQAPPDQADESDQRGSQQLLDEGQLDQLVAPIALYPDPLLAQVLVASTYPLEVVQAERWAEAHKDLKGEALTEALEKEDWDNSIKALVGVPDVLAMMNEDLDWTSKLGDAVLAQQSDVMDAVQRLRGLAYENGKLESNDQQTVTVNQDVTPADEQAPASEQPPPQQVIVIEPTSPETVYVPYYEPSVVYGSWPYPDYPPYYFEPGPGYIFGGAIATGLAWSAGFAIGNAIWGDGFDWRRDDINVDINRNVDFNKKVDINNKNINVSNWQHNSDHRRGVNYNNTEVRSKFSKGDLADKRDDFRGREPGGNRPSDRRPGNGALADKRPGDKRPGDKRPNVGDMEQALKKSDLAAKRPGGDGLADKKPGAGDKRPAAKKPDIGDKRANLQKPNAAKRPDVKKPDVKRPDVKRPDVKTPAAKKPDLKKTAARKPSGNAFDKRDGAKAKSYSKRGKSSAGNRSAAKLGSSRPSGRGGGGGRKGGGRRR